MNRFSSGYDDLFDAAEGASGGMSRSGGDRDPSESRGGSSRGGGTRGPSMGAPVDVVEVPEGLLIVVDLPGVAEADLEIAAAPRAIRLRASRRVPRPPGARVVRRERSVGRIERIVPVPDGFDSGSLEANLTAGVLAVMVPRREATEFEGGDPQGGSGAWNDG